MRGEIDLATFEDWFVTKTWNVHRSGNALAADLTYAVDALLAEYSSGSLSKGRLRKRLERYVETYRFQYGTVEGQPTVSATDRPTTQRQVVAVGK